MSEHWEYYPCHFGDGVGGTVVYDHGINETIDSLPAKRLGFKLTFHVSDESGLPSEEETPALEAAEDAIDGFARQNGGAYVGRMTFEGQRRYFTYVDADESSTDGFCAEFQTQHGYQLEYNVLDDAAKSEYWTYLFPSEPVWNWIQDCHVVRKLMEVGDSLTEPRRIDHWAGFPSADERDQFQGWLESEGFSIEEREATSETETFDIQFYRDDIPSLTDFTVRISNLRAQCEEMGGSYTGWESWVVRDAEAE